MTSDEQQEISDLAAELCYERVKFSYLWNALENAEIDAKADALRAKVITFLDGLIADEEAALEQREAA